MILNLQVTASSDDCWGCYTSFYPDYYAFTLTDVGLRIGDYNSNFVDYQSGMRFLNVTIPKGATITLAQLVVVATAWKYGIPMPTIIMKGQDADNPSTFSTWADYLGRARTAAVVNWTPAAWVAGTTYTSPDIKTIIQAIVNRAGWASGNSLVIFWSDPPGYGGISALGWYSWDGGSGSQLHIEYSLGSPGMASEPMGAKLIAGKLI
jgi:type IV pilus assembly protein PilY1